MTKVIARRPAAARKTPAPTKTVSKSDATKVRSIVNDIYGRSYVALDSTVYPTIKISSIAATDKPNVFKVLGSIDYQAWNGGDMGKSTRSLKATVNTKTESSRGNIPVDP